jgi:PBP4 family serine-type D-alanyl-D-alanine carboxypeptidase
MRTKTYSDTLYCNTGSITRAHINKNCSQLVAKSSDVGEKIKLKVPKYFPYIVENQAVTVAKNVPDRLHINIDGDKYIINGTLSKSNDSLLIGGVADDNFVHIKQNIKQELMKYGIKFAGKILYGKPKSGAKDIASFSKKMKDISAIAMKQSDNFITDYLLAEYATQNKRHEWRMATKDLKRFIFNKFNVDLKKSSFGDASGVSRLNLFSVNQFDSFLKAVSKNSKFEEIKSLMASPGDGSIIGDRFKGMPKIYVKSGTLANVSTIVGYFYNKDNELHSFVIMINNFYGENSKYRALQESIIKLAAE